MLSLYNLVLVVLSPLLLPLKAARWARRREDYEIASDRWSGGPALKREAGKVRVVFVALSWGEVPVLERVCSALESQRSDLDFVWAIRERAARDMVKSRFPNRKTAPMPFDFSRAAKNWLRSTQPDVVIIFEKFWWPNLVWSAKLAGAKVVLLNGRSRGRERAQYKLLTGLQRWVLRAFAVLLFADEAQVQRVRDVLPKTTKAIATGSIKFGFTEPQPSPDKAALNHWLEARAKDENGEPLPLLVAGSIRESDDNWVIEAWQKVNEQIPCALVVAPRQLKRADEVLAKLEALGPVSRRTQPLENSRLLLLDSMGELGDAYGEAMGAYVGGAVSGRGHNILEPLAWGVPVAYGPNRGDFEGAQKAAEEWHVGWRCHSAAELESFFRSVLSDEEMGWNTKQSAARMFEAQSGAFDRSISALLEAIPQSPQKA